MLTKSTCEATRCIFQVFKRLEPLSYIPLLHRRCSHSNNVVRLLCGILLQLVTSSLQVSASREPDHMVSTRKHETKFSSDENALKTLATPVPVALVWREGYVKNELKKGGKILNVIIIKSVELN